ncbi:hypothetical protein FVB9288_00086 [Flavobacterium sp. CECT 9288]|nr:hypothetical protein FVB9288_00086 [Flavobacterium sp. CECT 9288]
MLLIKYIDKTNIVINKYRLVTKLNYLKLFFKLNNKFKALTD